MMSTSVSFSRLLLCNRLESFQIKLLNKICSFFHVRETNRYLVHKQTMVDHAKVITLYDWLRQKWYWVKITVHIRSLSLRIFHFRSPEMPCRKSGCPAREASWRKRDPATHRRWKGRGMWSPWPSQTQLSSHPHQLSSHVTHLSGP